MAGRERHSGAEQGQNEAGDGEEARIGKESPRADDGREWQEG